MEENDKFTRASLKNRFKAGQIPTDEDFANLIDASLNLAEDGLRIGYQKNIFFTLLTGETIDVTNIRKSGSGTLNICETGSVFIGGNLTIGDSLTIKGITNIEGKLKAPNLEIGSIKGPSTKMGVSTYKYGDLSLQHNTGADVIIGSKWNEGKSSNLKVNGELIVKIRNFDKEYDDTSGKQIDRRSTVAQFINYSGESSILIESTLDQSRPLSPAYVRMKHGYNTTNSWMIGVGAMNDSTKERFTFGYGNDKKFMDKTNFISFDEEKGLLAFKPVLFDLDADKKKSWIDSQVNEVGSNGVVIFRDKSDLKNLHFGFRDENLIIYEIKISGTDGSVEALSNDNI